MKIDNLLIEKTETVFNLKMFTVGSAYQVSFNRCSFTGILLKADENALTFLLYGYCANPVTRTYRDYEEMIIPLSCLSHYEGLDIIPLELTPDISEDIKDIETTPLCRQMMRARKLIKSAIFSANAEDYKKIQYDLENISNLLKNDINSLYGEKESDKDE